MICKKCNTQNENSSIFCKQCGRKIKSKGRGFASMDVNKRKMIASLAGSIGGRAKKK